MTKQYSLYDGTPPHVKGSDTSRAAAESIRKTVGKGHRLVIHKLQSFGGLTDEELQHITGLGPSTERPRRIELVQMGMVVDSGVRRHTKSGRTATVWDLTDAMRQRVSSGGLP